MSDNLDDPLDALLAPSSRPGDALELQRKVLARTTGILRRRRRLKYVAWVSSLAACYVAGLVTMHWIPTTPPQQIVFVQSEAKPDKPEPKQETPPKPPTAVAVENLALDSADNQAELYRNAAELYRQEGDLASYIRCKDNALDAAKKEDLAVSPDDDFLTIALKRDRQKQEKRHAILVD